MPLLDGAHPARYHNTIVLISANRGQSCRAWPFGCKGWDCIVMDQTGKPFVPRSGMERLTQAISSLAARYLTPISIAVVAVGLLLVIVGPVRTLLARQTAGDSPTAPAAGLVTDVASGGSGDALTMGEVNRSMVPYTIIPDRPRNKVVTYTIQRGDTLESIASKFSLDRNSIFWANPDTLHDVHMIVPGVNLYILPGDGVYYKSDGTHSLQWIADYYKADVQDIISSDANNLQGASPDTIPPWGVRVYVPGGTGDFPDWTPPIVQTVNQTTGVVTTSFMPGMAGSCAPGIVGRGGTGAWAPPIPPGVFTFTQAFSAWHSGVDLAAVVGTSVTAADSGAVIFSGWVPQSWGYGILVVLDHGNGWTTYYAHLSGVAVGCGQFVPRGGLVGYVGTTGNSSGPHLHFETRWNHVPDNPLNQINLGG